ncbi:MAG: hypothetical protein M1274_05195 [Actinobacteria bacterium]|nr:hypothetical protein [Actinomycetota bacterium]
MKVETRLPYLKPEELDEEQKKFYDFNVEAMQPMPYVWLLEDGELNGPSNSLLHNAQIGNMLFPLNRAIIRESIEAVGGDIHELAVLATVASAKAPYAIYAHTKLAQKFGLADEKIAAVTAGHPASSFTEKESVAYDLTISLLQPGPIPGLVYRRAIAAFGERGLEKLVYAIGMFKLIGTILNAYNEPVPAED